MQVKCILLCWLYTEGDDNEDDDYGDDDYEDDDVSGDGLLTRSTTLLIYYFK